MTRIGVFVALLVAATPVPARAAEATEEAKAYFKAGAAAYAAGNYLAAIQALEAAYQATPLPAIAFSLAQAERRQYFVSREPEHLLRAIELFRAYVAAVESGGRRADATDALAQLEPLAIGLSAEPGEPALVRLARSAKTRIMVTSSAPAARISLDGAAPVAAPLITEVSAGRHAVRVTAEGFMASERNVVAIQGELVPVEIELEERPALVHIWASTDADLYVDGLYSRRIARGARIELSSGDHRLSFARKGRQVENVDLSLARGEARTVQVNLELTRQRIAAITLFAAGGVALGAGLGLGTLALAEEEEAHRIARQRNLRPLVPSELEQYQDHLEGRARYRGLAIGAFVTSAAAIFSGAILYELDEPNLREGVFRPRPARPARDAGIAAKVVPAAAGTGLGARFAW